MCERSVVVGRMEWHRDGWVFIILHSRVVVLMRGLATGAGHTGLHAPRVRACMHVYLFAFHTAPLPCPTYCVEQAGSQASLSRERNSDTHRPDTGPVPLGII